MPVFQLTDDLLFPPPELARDDGLLAVGGDLSEERLLLAYSLGIFPWFAEGDPILWWAPDPRLVLFPADLKISKRLARTIRQNKFTVTMDTAFSAVINNCAHIRIKNGEETWITEDMKEAYCKLHELGYAHSVECWQDNTLVGGIYGIALGAAFFGESMFSKVTDSSKVALVFLAQQLTAWNFDFIDCQVRTKHLVRLGAKEITGESFYALLKKSIDKPGRLNKWQQPPYAHNNTITQIRP
jgi:leucyl/phenylalanyl-tRNA--protein transferase